MSFRTVRNFSTCTRICYIEHIYFTPLVIHIHVLHHKYGMCGKLRVSVCPVVHALVATHHGGFTCPHVECTRFNEYGD